jgi:hypothetical protein
MPRKKPMGPKFADDIKKVMAQPIIMPRIPLTMKPDSDEWNRFVAHTDAYVIAQRLKKLEHLAQHYGLKNDERGLFSQGKLLALVLFLANDCVPGFQTVVEGQPTGKRGAPRKLDLLHDRRLLPGLLEVVKKASGAKTDQQAGEYIAEIMEGRKGDAKKKRGETLAKRASEGRRLISAH